MILKCELHCSHLLDLLLYVTFKTLKMSKLVCEGLCTTYFSGFSLCCPKGDMYFSHESCNLVLALKGL